MHILNGKIAIWYIPLKEKQAVVKDLACFLSGDEIERANNIRDKWGRDCFTIGRGTLRTILGLYTGLKPGQINFYYGPFGKPFLANPSSSEANIHFNLAHSMNLGLCALTLDREVGLDIEFIRPISEIETIVHLYFSARERHKLYSLPPGQRLVAFCNAWTQKEAFIKGLGQGLSYPLNRFDVSLIPGVPAQIISIDGDANKALAWSLFSFIPEPGYISTLAIKGSIYPIEFYYRSNM